MKKFSTLYLTPIIGFIIILLHLPSIERWLEGFSCYADFYIAGGLILLALINHVITVFSPFKKYKKLEREKWALLNHCVKTSVIKYAQYGIDLNFNIMVPKIVLWNNLELKKNHPVAEDCRKWRWFSSVFKFAWVSKNNTINKQLRLSVRQGIAGKVFKEGMVIVHDFTNRELYGLNKEQINLTKHLKILISVPIEEDDEDHSETKSGKILGVMNAESSSVASLNLYNDDALRKEITNDLISLSNICSKIL